MRRSLIFVVAWGMLVSSCGYSSWVVDKKAFFYIPNKTKRITSKKIRGTTKGSGVIKTVVTYFTLEQDSTGFYLNN